MGSINDEVRNLKIQVVIYLEATSELPLEILNLFCITEKFKDFKTS